MKNNLFSHNKKGSRGFYAALGISAVMIGSACFFAYNEGEKLTNQMISDRNITVSDAQVDKKVKDIPKETTTASTSKIHPITVVTAPVDYIVQPPEIEEAEYIPPVPDAEPVQAEIPQSESLDYPKPPLSNMENILLPFSNGELVKNETSGTWQTHNGTDIASEVGTEVYSVSAGEVIEVKDDPLWGVTVTIDHHNGFTSKYCSLSDELAIQKGDTVVSGDLIGYVGATADIESSSAPHLHIEIRHNGKFVDPLSLIE